MWVLRLDGAGNVVWERTFGGAEYDSGFSVAALEDGGFAVAGSTRSKGAGESDIWVLRLDGAGNVVWERTFGGADVDAAGPIAALADGGVAVAGFTTKGEGDWDFWVLRLDGAGNVVWERTFGGTEKDAPLSVVRLSEGGFAVAGEAQSKGAGGRGFWVLRLDGAGNTVWERTFGGAEDDVARPVVALADGGLAVAGYTKSKGAGESDAWVLRLDGAANVVWERTFGGAGDDQARSAVALADGGLAVVGYTESKGAGGQDLWVLRFAGAEEPTVVGAR